MNKSGKGPAEEVEKGLGRSEENRLRFSMNSDLMMLFKDTAGHCIHDINWTSGIRRRLRGLAHLETWQELKRCTPAPEAVWAELIRRAEI